MGSKRRKTTDRLRLLLDADVVIEAHRLGAWDVLCRNADVACASTVVRDEARFHSQDEFSVPAAIHLPSLVTQGAIAMLEATAADLAMVTARLTEDVTEGLHPGETEALALLLGRKAAAHLFCTGDRAAIQALALLGLSENGISLERALNFVGATKPLSKHLTEAYFQAALREGQERRLRGLGLRAASR